jgi:pilus assembly protein CpaC
MLNKLAVRVSPDINAAVVATLAEGDVVEALPIPNRQYWMAVQVNGKRGWTAAQWLHPVPAN